MEVDLTQQRREARAYLDMLSAEKLSAVHDLLESMLSPLERSLALAPIDDEPLTLEEAAAIEEARASLDRGEGIPHEEILAEFGLSSSETDSPR